MKKVLVALLSLALVTALVSVVFAAGRGAIGQGRGANGRQAGSCAVTQTDAVALTGVVKDVVAREAGARGGPVTFTLAAGDTATTVTTAPAFYLAQIGLTLANDQQLTVNGWQVNTGGKAILIARDVVVGETTYTLRDADGKPAWASRMRGACAECDPDKCAQCCGEEGQCTECACREQGQCATGACGQGQGRGQCGGQGRGSACHMS